jgi:ankyrin repeat protein
MFQKIYRILCIALLISQLIIAMHNTDLPTPTESLFNALLIEDWATFTSALEAEADPLWEAPLFGTTALHYAVYLKIPNEQFEKMVKAVIKHRGNLDSKNSFGKTALDLARENNEIEKEKILKIAGASSK